MPGKKKKKKERIYKDLILTLKKRLKEARLKKGKTQESILKTTGIHIGRLENKNYVMNVNVSTLKTLCDKYGIKLSDLLKGL